MHCVEASGKKIKDKANKITGNFFPFFSLFHYVNKLATRPRPPQRLGRHENFATPLNGPTVNGALDGLKENF